ITALYLLSGPQDSVVSSQGTRRPFLARPGTMRENAAPIVSDREMDVPVAADAGSAGGAPEPAGEEGAAVPPEGEAPAPLSEEQRIERVAMSAVSPAQGILQIEQYLAGLEAAAEASRLYSTMALLRLQCDPPATDEALAALAVAGELAGTAEDRHYAALIQANALHMRGDLEGACVYIRALLEDDDAVTVPGLQLQMKLGHLEMEAGRTGPAEEAYEGVAARALSAAESLGAEGLAVYRQACIQLARVYRSTGRTKEAEALAREMRSRMDAGR
ncbi:MAG: hypothetical protein JXR94_01290, partial [Candidatus Hydrogenedentes bacterium]|nr:hypothetical protein [Candidatus Hydrogenedentota bacterium]